MERLTVLVDLWGYHTGEDEAALAVIKAALKPAPLPKEVEYAMKNIEYLLACVRKSFNTDDAEAALAVLKAALRRYRELCVEVGEKP